MTDLPSRFVSAASLLMDMEALSLLRLLSIVLEKTDNKGKAGNRISYTFLRDVDAFCKKKKKQKKKTLNSDRKKMEMETKERKKEKRTFDLPNKWSHLSPPFLSFQRLQVHYNPQTAPKSTSKLQPHHVMHT